VASAELQGGTAEEVVDGEELGEGAGVGVDAVMANEPGEEGREIEVP
jgi:hypothetical protein